MQINKIKEREITKELKLKILAFFPLTSFLFGILAWLFDSNFSFIGIISGLANIVSTPTTLYTDFLEVGGVGSAMINASLISFFNLYLLRKYKLRINGLLISGFMTVMGFSYFGKNILNIIPIYIGGYLYSLYQDIEFKDMVATVMFGTGLAPVISQIMFGHFLPMHLSIPFGIFVGIFIGFVIMPLSTHMLKFHEGYNIYNIGFTAGIIGTVLASILRTMQFDLTSANILYTDENYFLMALLFVQFSFLIGIGIYINKDAFVSYHSILKYKGRSVTDFTFLVGYGITFFNMGLMGLLSLTFVATVGGVINGPVLAGIFSVVGFSSFGKHIKNCVPVATGVIFMAALIDADLSSTPIIITVLFSTTIAPISGTFGAGIGIFAGMLHFALATNIGVIHGGLNLYNNGFAGGLVAGFIVPVIEAFKRGEK